MTKPFAALFHSLEFRSLHERLKELKFHGAAAAAPVLEVNSISDLTSESELRAGRSNRARLERSVARRE